MIKFTTINVDGMEVEREFNTAEEIEKDWYSDDCSLPANDDEVISAEVDGEEIEAEIFLDIIKALGIGWKKEVIEKAESLNWNVKIRDNGYCLFETSSPEGQDYCVEFDDIDSKKKLIKELDNYCENFDVSEEAYLWLDSDGHGKNGAPYDMKDVYDDMQWCLDNTKELLEAIRNN